MLDIIGNLVALAIIFSLPFIGAFFIMMSFYVATGNSKKAETPLGILATLLSIIAFAMGVFFVIDAIPYFF